MVVAASSLADCRGDVKLLSFSGREQDWPSWCVKAEAFFTLVGWGEYVATAEAQEDKLDITNVNLGVNGVNVSKALYAILVTKLEAKALGIVTLEGKHEGLAAWWALKREYEPVIGNRLAAMLTGLLNPPWSADTTNGRPFADLIVDWENDTARYEIQSGKQFGDEYKVVTLLVHPRASAHGPAERTADSEAHLHHVA